MPFGRLQKFCCCSLRTGVIVAAVINALSVVILLWGGILLITAADIYDDHKEHQDLVQAWRIVGGLNLAEGIIGFFVLVSLSIGIHTNNAPFFLPWLIAYCILIILSIALAIYNLVVQFAANTFLSLLLHIFMVYVWFSVYAFYQDLKEERVSAATTTTGRGV